MYQVKIFRFTINNRSCSDVDDDKRLSWHDKEARELYTEEMIEHIINDFLRTHNIVSVNSNTFTCRKNDDRLRDDDVDIIYTITYEINKLDFEKEILEKNSSISNETHPNSYNGYVNEENAYRNGNNFNQMNYVNENQEVTFNENLNRKRNNTNNIYNMGYENGNKF